MRQRAKVVLAAAALGVVLGGMPAAGGEGEGRDAPGREPEELAREGVEKLMRALEGLLQAIPQYGAPYVDEDGDIVIPRLNPPAERDENGEDAPDEPGVTETRT